MDSIIIDGYLKAELCDRAESEIELLSTGCIANPQFLIQIFFLPLLCNILGSSTFPVVDTHIPIKVCCAFAFASRITVSAQRTTFRPRCRRLYIYGAVPDRQKDFIFRITKALHLQLTTYRHPHFLIYLTFLAVVGLAEATNFSCMVPYRE